MKCACEGLDVDVVDDGGEAAWRWMCACWKKRARGVVLLLVEPLLRLSCFLLLCDGGGSGGEGGCAAKVDGWTTAG